MAYCGYMKRGRPRDNQAIEQVQKLLKTGLDKAAIARAMKKDPAQIQRWIRYATQEEEKKENDIIDINR